MRKDLEEDDPNELLTEIHYSRKAFIYGKIYGTLLILAVDTLFLSIHRGAPHDQSKPFTQTPFLRWTGIDTILTLIWTLSIVVFKQNNFA